MPRDIAPHDTVDLSHHDTGRPYALGWCSASDYRASSRAKAIVGDQAYRSEVSRRNTLASNTPFCFRAFALSCFRVKVKNARPSLDVPTCRLRDGNVGVRQSNDGSTSPSPRRNAAIAFLSRNGSSNFSSPLLGFGGVSPETNTLYGAAPSLQLLGLPMDQR
jgi:hypothetical protein